MEGLTITVDGREWRSEVPTQLTAPGVPFSTITLAVGDYAVGGRAIEHKTVADLHSSLVDRRLWSQLAALRRDLRRAYVLVEGDDLDDRPVPTRAVSGALLEILDNRIRLLRTPSPEETAPWLTVLARQEQRFLRLSGGSLARSRAPSSKRASPEESASPARAGRNRGT